MLGDEPVCCRRSSALVFAFKKLDWIEHHGGILGSMALGKRLYRVFHNDYVIRAEKPCTYRFK